MPKLNLRNYAKVDLKIHFSGGEYFLVCKALSFILRTSKNQNDKIPS
jgi:hypothetical protein